MLYGSDTVAMSPRWVSAGLWYAQSLLAHAADRLVEPEALAAAPAHAAQWAWALAWQQCFPAAEPCALARSGGGWVAVGLRLPLDDLAEPSDGGVIVQRRCHASAQAWIEAERLAASAERGAPRLFRLSPWQLPPRTGWRQRLALLRAIQELTPQMRRLQDEYDARLFAGWDASAWRGVAAPQ